MPLVSDRDVFAAAKLVIDRHGGSALYYANGRAETFQDEGDEIGAETWRRIAAAVEELQRTELREGEAIN